MTLSSATAPVTTGVSVQPWESSFEAAWDAFVWAHPDATPFHLIRWKRVLERAFGYKQQYLACFREGRICGVLPLFLVENFITGRTLISTPFAVYGGVLAADEEAWLALNAAAQQLARELKVDFLELRNRAGAIADGCKVKDLYVAFEGTLLADAEAMMSALPKNTRYMVRKALKNDLRVEIDAARLPAFYDIYAENVRNLGTPVFSYGYFEAFCEEFADMLEMSYVYHGNTPCGAAATLVFRDEILLYYACSTMASRALAPNNFMYWELMRRWGAQGKKKLDLGRSKVGTGAYTFKTHWNYREYPLPYQFYLVRRQEMPNFSPTNKKFAPAIAIWQKLPLPVTKLLGPRLVRLFP